MPRGLHQDKDPNVLGIPPCVHDCPSSQISRQKPGPCTLSGKRSPETGSKATEIKSPLVLPKWSRGIQPPHPNTLAAHTKKSLVWEESVISVTSDFIIKYGNTNNPSYLMLPFLAPISQTGSSSSSTECKSIQGEILAPGKRDLCQKLNWWIVRISPFSLYTRRVTIQFFLVVNFKGYLPEQSSWQFHLPSFLDVQMPTIKGQHLGEHSPSPPLDQLAFLPVSMYILSDIT